MKLDSLNPRYHGQVAAALYGQSSKPSAGYLASHPEPEQAVQRKSLGTGTGKAAYSGRVRISIESVRSRLIDPDNLCPKYFIDCCRYAGLISDDSADAIEILTNQRKAGKDETPHTAITLEPIP